MTETKLGGIFKFPGQFVSTVNRMGYGAMHN